MLTSYVRGASPVPLSDETIGQAFVTTATCYGSECAVVSRHQNVRLSWGELRVQVERAARGLLALGVGAGDRVGLWSDNRVEWLVTKYAVAMTGGVLVNLNPSYKALEIEHALAHAGVSVLVTAPRCRATDHVGLLSALVPVRDDGRPIASARFPALRSLVCLGDAPVAGFMRWDELRALGDAVPPAALAERAAAVRSDDPAQLMYTSGTTGVPKGATMSHHSLINSGFFIGERLEYTARDRVCLPVPLFHIFGCILGALAALTHGAALVLPSAIFDARACLDSIDAEGCTAFYGVPGMFAALLGHPGFGGARLDSLRTGIMAGAPCPPDLMRDVMTRLHMPQVTICYGMTEAGTLCQSMPGDPVERRVSSVGAVHPHVEIKVVDPESRTVVPRGTPGELWARGYSLMSSYWNDPGATRQAIDADGWIRTGDLATMRPDGYINIVGRLKDVVISGGQNIYPREIEEILRAHGAVKDVAVIGVPDAIYGEAACACVLLRERDTLTADELRRYCRDRLAPHNVPRRVLFLDDLPTTASGKVQKFRLREVALHALGLAAGSPAEPG